MQPQVTQPKHTDSSAVLLLIKQLAETAAFSIAQKKDNDRVYDAVNSIPPTISFEETISYILKTLGYDKIQSDIEHLLLATFARAVNTLSKEKE